MQRLLRRTALAVNRHARNVFGHTSHQPSGATNVACLTAKGITATPDHVVDEVGIDAGTLDQRADRVRSKIGRMKLGKAALLAANRRTDGVYDISFRHFLSREQKSGQGQSAE